MNDLLQQLENMALMALMGVPASDRTSDLIRDRVNELSRLLQNFESVTVEQAEQVAKRLEERVSVTQQIGSVLVHREHVPWLESSRQHIEPYYWDRYRQYLIGGGFPPDVVTTLDSVTDRILGYMGNPRSPDSWDRRGLVVGHVQSGKTANYTGLACKAADAGYKLIVIIAGVHNNLRNQTQRRIDEGFVGSDSTQRLSRPGQQSDLWVGVGQLNHNRHPFTFTSAARDFNKSTAASVRIPSLNDLHEPAVVVVKKNSRVLQSLIEWLQTQSARGAVDTIDAPMLLVDDEADNASINVKYGHDEVSRINGQIRDLLRLFRRRTYVGYTATPFANIFIDPDTDDDMKGEDLFPRSFIVSLDPPSNYFGPQGMFLENDRQPESHPFIRHIADNEDRLPLFHTIDFQLHSLPESLLNAVCTFILARAIRLERGHQNQHMSMLVNASRFNNVQGQLRLRIHERLNGIKSSIRVNGSLPPDRALEDEELRMLNRVWLNEFEGLEEDWPQVQGRLLEAVEPIKVVEVNSRSAEPLNYGDYGEGMNVIAVGGYSLSRGLTLEGLTVSYFLRNSVMYDTLMQMCRWFGYRPGYKDLCRVWMPEEAEGWYRHISESTEELRDEIRRMEEANATPEEFGLKVRSHPDSLIITARNKMGSGESISHRVGLANRFAETATILRNDPSLEANRSVARRLATDLREAGHPPPTAERVAQGRLLRDVPKEPILSFIGSFANHPRSYLTDGDTVRRYIENRRDGSLDRWDVLFPTLRSGEGTFTDNSILGISINCQTRTEGSSRDRTALALSTRQRVASRGAERAGLSDSEIAEAERTYRREEGIPDTAGGGVNYPDRIYRSVRKRPLLIIHLVKINPATDSTSEIHEPVVAWSMSIPDSETPEETVEYMVNTTWWREFNLDLQGDELDSDND